MNLKSTAILLVILAALLGVFFLFKNEPEKGARDTAKMITPFEPEKVTSLRIENAERGQKIVLAKVGDAWEMREPIRAAADADQAKFMTRYFADFDGAKLGKVGDARANPAELGLDKPRLIVEIEGAAEKPITIRIGADDLKKSEIFLQIGDEVFRAPRTLYNSASKPHGDLRDRKAFTLPSLELTSIELTRGEETTILAKEGAEWRISAPFRGRADGATASKLAIGLASLRIARFASDTTPPPPTYGLEAPSLRVTLRAGEKLQTLTIGRTDGEITFAQREGQTNVWGISEGDLTNARRPAVEFRDPVAIGTFAHENVKSIRWKGEAGEIAFTFDPITRKARLSAPREAEVDRDAYEQVVKALDGLRADTMENVSGNNLAEAGLAPASRWVELQLKDAVGATRLDVGTSNDVGTFVKRASDDFFLRVPKSALAFLARPVTDFVSREVVAIDSYVAGHVEIDVATSAGPDIRKLVYEKDDSNKWKLTGVDDEATAFADFADVLWHAKGTEVLALDPKDTPLAKPEIEVRVYRKLYGDPQDDPNGADKAQQRVATLRFARDASGAWLANGITGVGTSGGFTLKSDGAVAQRLIALAASPVTSRPASAPATQPAASQPAGK